MAHLHHEELEKLKSFFHNLDTFRNPKAEFLPMKDGTVLSRADCLNILRSNFSFEGLSENQLKDDNSLINHLTSSKFNQNQILEELDRGQREELYQELGTSKPHPEDTSMVDQPAGDNKATSESQGSDIKQANPSHQGIPPIPSGRSASAPETTKIRQLPPDKIQSAETKKVTQQSSKQTASSPISLPPKPLSDTSSQKFNFSAVRPPAGLTNMARDLSSGAGRGFYRFIGKNLTPGRIATGVGMGVGGALGSWATGGASAGLFGGAIGGGAMPALFKNGVGGRFFGRVGNGLIDASSRLSNTVGGGGGGFFRKKRRILLRILIWVLLFAVGVGILIIGTTSPPGGSGPIDSSSDISSCTFTGAGESKAFASPVFAGFMSQAATKAGIPPAVLATVISHETSDFRNALDTHDAIQNDYYYFVNPEGTTRAVGLGQISVGRTTIGDRPENMAVVDHCKSLFGGVIQKAAANLGKQIRDVNFYCVDDVNERVKRFCQTDYFALSTPKYVLQDSIEDGSYLNLCRVKDNLAVSAAKLADNIGSGSWNTDNDLRQSIQRYYGACGYIGGNYCDEALTDYKNCQPASGGGSTTHPVAPTIDPSGLKTAIFEKFGLTMNYYDSDHLKWAWEKLHEVSNTKFVNLVKGSVINASSGSEQVDCPGSSVAVHLDQYPEALFKYGLIHELGHVIKNCQPGSANFASQFSDAYKAESGVTYYAKNAFACTGSIEKDEDYAEMIALYLSPNANIQMARCATNAGITHYSNLKTEFPRHYDVAKKILGDF